MKRRWTQGGVLATGAMLLTLTLVAVGPSAGSVPVSGTMACDSLGGNLPAGQWPFGFDATATPEATKPGGVVVIDESVFLGLGDLGANYDHAVVALLVPSALTVTDVAFDAPGIGSFVTVAGGVEVTMAGPFTKVGLGVVLPRFHVHAYVGAAAPTTIDWSAPTSVSLLFAPAGTLNGNDIGCGNSAPPTLLTITVTAPATTTSSTTTAPPSTSSTTSPATTSTSPSSTTSTLDTAVRGIATTTNATPIAADPSFAG